MPASSVTLGAMLDSEDTLVTPRSCSAWAVKAEMAMGTFCTFSARFCAVTTISSTAAAGAAEGAAPCAMAGAVHRTAEIATMLAVVK